MDLKSKQHPMGESSAPALPAASSRPPRPCHRLTETTLQSAGEADSSSEVWDKVVW